MRLLDLVQVNVINKLAESIEEDMEKLHLANESFENIVTFIQRLRKDPKRFKESFYTDNKGRLTGFSIEGNFAKSKQRPEYANLFIQFYDHELYNVKNTVKAKAARVIDPATNKLIELHITLFVDVPQEAKQSTKSYNAWIVKNLEDILQNPRYRSSFVHEFTHTLDFRRVDPSYLVSISKQKKEELEAKIKRDREKYINDPLELNAYYYQAMSDLYASLLKTETPEEWNTLVGNSPQEFVEILLSYLRPQAKKRLTPENIKRFMKRASSAWEYLRLL